MKCTFNWFQPYVSGNFMCSKCGKSFKNIAALKLHDVVHSDQTVQCPDCPAKFKTQSHLRTHRQIHQNVRYKCNQCSATFSSKNCLSSHTSEYNETIFKTYNTYQLVVTINSIKISLFRTSTCKRQCQKLSMHALFV